MKKCVFIVLATLMFMVPTAYAEEKPACDISNRDEQGWSQGEKDILGSVYPHFRDLFSRQNPCSLTIQFRNGKSKTFTSFLDKNYNDDPVTYFLDTIYEKQDYALVGYWWMGGERIGYELIDLQSGAEVSIDDKPEWSPSNKSFALAIDNEATPEENGAQIFLCADRIKACRQVFEMKDSSIRASQVYWASSKELFFTLKSGYGTVPEDPELEYRLHMTCNKKSCKRVGKLQIAK